MAATGMRRVMFRVHMWTGLLAGLYICVVFVTGATLVYRIELQRALDPHLFTPREVGPLAEAATIMERVADAYPHHRLAGVDAPTTARPTYLGYVTRGEEFATVLIDPVSTAILGELPERSLVRILRHLHYDLLAGRIGRIVNGVGAGCVLLLCVTGLVIWWPGRRNLGRGFIVDLRRHKQRVAWQMHRAVGIWTVVLVAVWASTGFSFIFASQVRFAVNWISPIAAPRPPLSGAQSSPSPPDDRFSGSTPADRASHPRPWRTAIAQAQRHAPGQHVARVVVPSTDRSAFLVLFASASPTAVGRALTPVYLDRFTLHRLHETPAGRRSAGDLLMAWLTPLHVGDFGGEPVKAAWFILGFAPPLLFATGFMVWCRRVVRARWSAAVARPGS